MMVTLNSILEWEVAFHWEVLNFMCGGEGPSCAIT